MDVARTAIKNGSKKVYIMCRRGPEDIEAEKTEVEYAKFDGVKFEYYKAPVEIVNEGIFASGDVVTGAKTVVAAVRVSKLVAQTIDEYVSENYK